MIVQRLKEIRLVFWNLNRIRLSGSPGEEHVEEIKLRFKNKNIKHKVRENEGGKKMTNYNGFV